jgi:hypothetical protein
LARAKITTGTLEKCPKFRTLFRLCKGMAIWMDELSSHNSGTQMEPEQEAMALEGKEFLYKRVK